MKNTNRWMLRGLATGLVLATSTVGALRAQDDSSKAQNQPPAQGRPAEASPANRRMGIITSVGVDRFEIKGRDGTAQTVMVNAQTHYQQDQKDIQLEDLKAGDRVFVRGQANDNNEFVATAVNRVTGEGGPMRGHRAFGQITAIEGNQLKVQNPRQGERTVVVNEQTTFMKDGQPIAQKDLKVGDRIFAMGDEVNGQFVATRVMSGQFQRGQGQGHRDNDNH